MSCVFNSARSRIWLIWTAVGWDDTLSNLAQELSVLLERALEMWEWIGRADQEYDSSYLDQSSIAPHHQNSRFSPWTALIELVRDSWDVIASRDLERARVIAKSWGSSRYPVFRRLRMYAVTQRTDILPFDEGLKLLLEEDGWWLWSSCTQREKYRLLNVLWPKLDEKCSDLLIEAVLRGPPRKMFRSDITEEAWRFVRESDIWRHLAKFKASGRDLPPNAAQALKDLGNAHPNLALSDDDRDEFPGWVGPAEWVPPEFAEASGELLPLSRRDITQKVSDGEEQDLRKEWSELAERRPLRALTALVQLARQDVWQGYTWKALIEALGTIPRKSQFWKVFASALLQAPPELMAEVLRPLAFWVRESSKSLPAEREELLWRLWDRLWEVAPSGTRHIADGDVLDRAINSAAGDLATVLVDQLLEKKLKSKSGLPPDFAKRITRITAGRSEAHALGRVILASRLYYLHAVDPGWTNQNLLPHFDWGNSPEAAAVWDGYLWSSKIYPGLFAKLKISLFEALKHRPEFHDRVANIGGFFVVICIRAPQWLTVSEMRDGLRALDAKGRQSGAAQIHQMLERAESKAPALWRDRIEGFIQDAWPKDKETIEAGSAYHLALASVGSGEAFPEAVSTVESLLCPIDSASYIAVRLFEAGHAERFPEASLRLLAAIYSEAEVHLNPEFRSVLEKILSAFPQATDDPEYRRLDDYLKRRGT